MDKQLTDEQLVLRGLSAERILENEEIQSFISEMRSDYLTCIGNTSPEDKQTRDILYYQYRGLTDLLAHLESYRTAAYAIQAKQEAEELAADQPEDMDTD